MVKAEALRKENQSLKVQVDTLTAEIDKLKSAIEQMESPSSRESIEASLNTEAQSSLDFLSTKYDFEEFRRHAQREIQRLNLLELKSKLDMVGKAIEAFEAYSYQFNAKIMGIPEIGSPETAKDTSELCVALFNGMGARVSLQDIDVAHSVQNHNQNGGPKPIICKFVRRLAKYEVMARRHDACKVDPVTPMVKAEALRKENQSLKVLVDTLTEIDKLKSAIQQMEPPSSRESIEASLNTEAQSSLDFLSTKYDDFEEFGRHAQREIQRLNLLEIKTKVDMVGKAIEDFQAYSYQFNAKIIGIPEIGSPETAKDTSELCVPLFNGMGARVSLQDIDVAHRVQSYNQNGGPKPIICKFVRRLAKYEVMARRHDACKVDPVTFGFSDSVSFDSVRIFDYLTPNQQQILYEVSINYDEAKKFKDRHKFQYCWAKNSKIYLRKTSDSRPIKITSIGDLQRLEDNYTASIVQSNS
ncbi:hypothetical protein AWC38_SpisGene11095 [Stylophora pistillata]|uniref:FP protein C-terminal domain-containing protein n=1 Tax=Stylophora pistillata TaxID=50429 RepID=A0A2B4S5I0_STYPI|nr:hypothetical protein AWC38_SpisGene11095 [Stylophora pistillata]